MWNDGGAWWLRLHPFVPLGTHLINQLVGYGKTVYGTYGVLFQQGLLFLVGVVVTRALGGYALPLGQQFDWSLSFDPSCSRHSPPT